MRKTAESRTAGFGALAWLAVANFSMGIDGYVLTGLLPQIAGDLRVSEAAAGQLMTVFALTGAIAGPVLSALTGRWERKGTILGSLAVFVLGNLMVAVAPAFAWALAGRVVSAVGGALLAAVITSYVVAKTPPERRGRALSIVMGGWLAATALGVPLGLVVGQQDWRIPLFLVVVVGVLAIGGIVRSVPRLHLPPLSLRATLRPLTRGRILLALVVPMALMCASYFCFTYAALIIGPRTGTGFAMIAVLFGYGVMSLIGNLLSGRLTDGVGPTRVITTLILALIAVAALGSATLGLPGVAGAVAIVLWFLGCAVFFGGSGVALQARVSAMAPESVALLVALNTSAMHLGSALGSGLGGGAIAGGLPADALVPLSSGILVVALGVHLFVGRRAWRVPDDAPDSRTDPRPDPRSGADPVPDPV